jgi:hypothetical protein
VADDVKRKAVGGDGERGRKMTANKAGVYNFRCVCGANISTANPTGKCWDCGRSWELGVGSWTRTGDTTRR